MRSSSSWQPSSPRSPRARSWCGRPSAVAATRAPTAPTRPARRQADSHVRLAACADNSDVLARRRGPPDDRPSPPWLAPTRLRATCPTRAWRPPRSHVSAALAPKLLADLEPLAGGDTLQLADGRPLRPEGAGGVQRVHRQESSRRLPSMAVRAPPDRPARARGAARRRVQPLLGTPRTTRRSSRCWTRARGFGSRRFALAAKRFGVDAIVLRGALDRPSWLHLVARSGRGCRT